MPLEFDIDRVSAEARVGRTLRGKWHLDDLIDIGGMAAVYAATHRNGMRGAVKVLHSAASIHPEAKERFLREGYIANKVAHRNSVRVLDDDVDDDGSLFVVMELLRGATLQECAGAAGGRLAPAETLLIVDQLLDVLDSAHRLGIVHRDIKPENIFLTTEGQVKLLDFGVAEIRDPETSDRTPTVAGLLMGSPAFMPPEQARGRWDLVDARSDLWSLGATMFTLLSGEPVHTEQTVPELLAAAVRTPARSLSSALPAAHPELVRTVDRALRTDPAERWANARAMRHSVRAAYFAMYGAPLASASLGRNEDPSPAESKEEEEYVFDLFPTSVARTNPSVLRPRRGHAVWLLAGALAVVSLAAAIDLPLTSQFARSVLEHASARLELARTK